MEDAEPLRSGAVLVLAAHPDDETIGAAGLLLSSPLPAVAFLTDGAPLDRAWWPEGVNGTREAYARRREREARRALGLAGVDAERLFFFGAPDQQSAHRLLELVERTAELLVRLRPDAVLTHAYEGGHPDHDSAALAASLALEVMRQRGFRPPALFEYAGYHARDGRLIVGEFLGGTAGVSTHVLGGPARLRKEQMLACYESQRAVLSMFEPGVERFRRAPPYDFLLPPHPGRLHYERQGWMEGECWRALAAAALAAVRPRS